MTQLWDPYKHKLDGRAYRDRIGRPYYGPSALRRLMAVKPQVSIIDRATDYYSAHTWPAWALIVLACAAVGFGIVRAI
jgi:hypothetical protein